MIDLKKSWRSELAPSPSRPNRLARATLIAVLCGLVVIASKALSLPETALSAYLIFFASKENASLSAATGIGMILMAFLGVGLIILLMMLSAGAPMLRILLMFSITFGCMYVARSTSAGVIAATLGMVFFELLSALDFLPFPSLLLRGVVWLIPIVVLPMGLLVIGSLLFSRSAIEALSESLSHRIQLIRNAIATPEPEKLAACRAVFLEGGSNLEKLKQTAIVTGRLTPKNARKATRLHDVTTQLLARCATGQIPENSERLLQQELTKDEQIPPAPQSPPPDQDAVIGIESDDESGKESVQFAIKATLSVAICYSILTLLNWPAIHTITITAFLVSLGSTAETLHKATLRLTGCLIGAVISLFCLIVIVPHFTHAADLAILTIIVAFPAAWIAVGRENSSYIGMQIALVFFLSVLNTTGPSADVSVAWGRIVGIILGNLVVATVFLSLWPHGSLRFIERNLNRALSILGKSDKSEPGQGLLLGKACDALAAAGEGITKIQQGWGLGSATYRRANDLHQIHADLESIALSSSDPSNPENLERIRARLAF